VGGDHAASAGRISATPAIVAFGRGRNAGVCEWDALRKVLTWIFKFASSV
jgi:hypothetical protein